MHCCSNEPGTVFLRGERDVWIISISKCSRLPFYMPHNHSHFEGTNLETGILVCNVWTPQRHWPMMRFVYIWVVKVASCPKAFQYIHATDLFARLGFSHQVITIFSQYSVTGLPGIKFALSDTTHVKGECYSVGKGYWSVHADRNSIKSHALCIYLHSWSSAVELSLFAGCVIFWLCLVIVEYFSIFYQICSYLVALDVA